MGPIQWLSVALERLRTAVDRIQRWLGILLLVVVGLLVATLAAAGAMAWFAVAVCGAWWCRIPFGVGAVLALAVVVTVAPLAWFLATRWFLVRVARRRAVKRRSP
jgi:apolipoprotein N-acyltransferase